MQAQKEDQSLGDLFAELSQEVSALVRQEAQLARTEITQKAKAAAKDAAFIAAGGLIAYGGFLAIIAGIVVLLGYAIPLWLSAVIIGVLVAIAGYMLFLQGRNNLRATNVAPQETLDTLKEDATWARNQVK